MNLHIFSKLLFFFLIFNSWFLVFPFCVYFWLMFFCIFCFWALCFLLSCSFVAFAICCLFALFVCFELCHFWVNTVISRFKANILWFRVTFCHTNNLMQSVLYTETNIWKTSFWFVNFWSHCIISIDIAINLQYCSRNFFNFSRHFRSEHTLKTFPKFI